MIRFILRRARLDGNTGFEWTETETLSADVPELEARLLRGGYGDEGYDHTEIVGAEVYEPPEEG